MTRRVAASMAGGTNPHLLRRARMPALAGRDPVGYAEHAFLLFLIVFPAMGTLVLPSSSFSDGGSPSPLSAFDIGKLTFYPSALGLVILCAARYREVIATALKALPILTFSVWAFVSCLWAPEFLAAFNTTGRMFVIVLGAVYISARMAPIDIIRILTQAFAISIAISLICVLLFPRIGYNSTLMGYESAWRGAMAQKNFLGGLMTYGVIVGYYANLYRSNLRIVSLFVLFGAMVMTVMAQSATSIISVVVTAFVLCLLAFINNARNNFEKSISLWLLFASIAMFLFATVFSEELFQLIGRSSNLTGRSEIWPLVWGLIQNNPVRGYGHTFWTLESPVKLALWAQGGWKIAHAHNAYLDIWLQTGLPGLVIAILFILKGFGRTITLVVRGVSPIGFFWSALFFVAFAKSFTETQWVDPNASTIFWTTLAYIGLVNLSQARPQQLAPADVSRQPAT